MEDLPVIILQNICYHIVQQDPQRTSLLAFALSSRACRAASARERFSRIIINSHDKNDFRKDLLHLDQLLGTSDCKRYVRILKVSRNEENCGPSDKLYPNEDEDDDKGVGTFDITQSRARACFLRGRGVKQFDDNEARYDDLWNLFVRFIDGLALSEFVWASTEQVPTIILSELHARHPTCRLHVHNFDLKSISRKDGLHDIDMAESLLVSSPLLHSITSLYSTSMIAGVGNYNEEAIRQIVANPAQRVKHVDIRPIIVPRPGQQRRAAPPPPPRAPWQGFYPITKGQPKTTHLIKGNLHSLTIEGWHPVSQTQLLAWAAYANFSGLQSLKLLRSVEFKVLESLASMAETGGLSCIHTLQLADPVDRDTFQTEIDQAMEKMISLLQPIKWLALAALTSAPLDTLLERHGSSLRHLHLDEFILSASQVNRICHSCPNIRDLDIEFLRTAGNAEEVDVYRTLGSMPHLRKLVLNLQCTSYRHRDGPHDYVLSMGPSDDPVEEEEMATAMHDVLINAALDQDLARAIFDKLVAANEAVHDPLPPKLFYIKLTMGGAYALNGQMMSHDFAAILRWIGRSWICERDPRDTHCHVTSMREVGKKRRLDDTRSTEDDIDELYGVEQYGKIWKSLWPDTERGWRNGWKSFPLLGDRSPNPMRCNN